MPRLVLFATSTGVFLLGLELFLRHSTVAYLKLSAISLVALAVLTLGWPRSRRYFWWKLLSALLVSSYLAYSAPRFPGLLKEPLPLSFSVLASLYARSMLFLLLLLLVIVPAIRYAYNRWLSFILCGRDRGRFRRSRGRRER